MRRVARKLTVAVAAVAVGAGLARCTCTGPCADDGDCGAAAFCSAGRCVPALTGAGGVALPGAVDGGVVVDGDAGPDAPAFAIARVDGDGTLRAPVRASVPDEVLEGDARVGAHRVRSALIIEGPGLASATSAHIEQGDVDVGATLSIEQIEGDTMRVRIESAGALQAGLFTLVVTGLGAVEARAQVFILQGEPGPASLVEPRAPAACAAGGVGLAFGVDVDGDGALDPTEENAALARDVCNGVDGVDGVDGAAGDSLFQCNAAGDDCDTDATLRVRGRALLASVDEPTTVLVPNDAPSVSAALALFDGLSIEAPVTIELAPGTFAEPAQLTPLHPDSERFNIRGAGAASTALLFTNTNGFVLEGRSLGTISALTIDGNDDVNTTGVFVADGGRVTLAAGVVVQDFGVGVAASRNGTAFASGVLVSSCTQHGFFANRGGHIHAPSSRSDFNGQNGYVAEFSGSIEATSCGATGNNNGIGGGNGAAVVHGGSANFNACNFGVNVNAMQALFMGYIFADGAVTTSTGPDAVAQFNSTIRCTTCPGGGERVADATSQIVP